MDKDYNRVTVSLLSRAYIGQKLKLKEADLGIIKRSEEELKNARNIVTHIENVIEIMNEKERFILENELLHGKTGKWYIGLLSEPTYYRNRKKAYDTFLTLLEK